MAVYACERTVAATKTYLGNGGVVQPLLGWLEDKDVVNMRLACQEFSEFDRPFKTLCLNEENYTDGLPDLYGDIERIRLSGLDLDDDQVISLVRTFPKVQEIALERLDKITDECVVSLGTELGRELRCIELVDCYHLTNRMVGLLGFIFPGLKRLVLDNIPFKNADWNGLVGLQQWELSSLTIRRAKVTTLRVPWVLEELEIVDCDRIDWRFIERTDLTSLRRMCLDNQIKDNMLLREVVIGGARFEVDDIFRAVILNQDLRQLRDLTLKGVTTNFDYWPVQKLDASGKVEDVSRYFRDLEELVWRSLIKIDDVEFLKRGCPKLHKLSVHPYDLGEGVENGLKLGFPDLQITHYKDSIKDEKMNRKLEDDKKNQEHKQFMEESKRKSEESDKRHQEWMIKHQKDREVLEQQREKLHEKLNEPLIDTHETKKMAIRVFLCLLVLAYVLSLTSPKWKVLPTWCKILATGSVIGICYMLGSGKVDLLV